MTRVVVLPRGINVGARHRVPMAALREVLAAEGFTDVRTILQSGNIIVTRDDMDADDVGAHVGRLMAHHFGVDVPCLTRTADEIRAVAALDPLRDVALDGSKYLVAFLSAAPSPAAAQKVHEHDGPEVLHLDGRDLYLWAPDGVLAAAWGYARAEREFEVAATARNWNTVQKIVAAL